jgi:hypothetical protein
VALAEEEVVVPAQRDVGHGALASQRAGSFQIGVDDLDQIVRARGALLFSERGRTHMLPNSDCVAEAHFKRGGSS